MFEWVNVIFSSSKMLLLLLQEMNGMWLRRKRNCISCRMMLQFLGERGRNIFSFSVTRGNQYTQGQTFDTPSFSILRSTTSLYLVEVEIVDSCTLLSGMEMSISLQAFQQRCRLLFPLWRMGNLSLDWLHLLLNLLVQCFCAFFSLIYSDLENFASFNVCQGRLCQTG